MIPIFRQEEQIGNETFEVVRSSVYRSTVLNRNERVTLGNVSKTFGVGNVSELSHQNYHTIYYHSTTNRDPNNWGGPRAPSFKCNEEELSILEHLVFDMVNERQGKVELKDLVEMGEDWGYFYSKGKYSRIFKKYGFSKKKCSNVGWTKYDPDNIEYYVNFVDWILDIDPMRLHYTDEVHIVDKDTYSQYAWGETSEPVVCLRGQLENTSVSCTLMTTLRDTHGIPALCDYREDSNCEIDFILNMESFLEMGFVPRGDIVIYDGAPGHTAEFALEDLENLENQYGVTFVRQPKFSPEKNACEFVFQMMKNSMRRLRNVNIESYVVNFLADQLTFGHMRAFYRHSIIGT